MPKGTITTFAPEKGFGTLTLETGEVLPFDANACNRTPKVGDVGEVVLGTNRVTGKPKAHSIEIPEKKP